MEIVNGIKYVKYDDVDVTARKLQARIGELESRQPDTELVKFARKVIAAHCWEYDSMDGLDIQDLAEVSGLIEQHTATKDDVDEESDFEVGDPIYKFSEILKEKE